MPNIEGIEGLLSAYPAPIGQLAHQVADAVVATHPELKTKILMGWRAVSFRHAKAGYICGVFLQQGQVQLLFEQGRLLSDPEGVLRGDTKQTRFIGFVPGDEIPVDIVGLYISEAIALKSL